MVKFKFFVHCNGWKAGGYENTHFAYNARHAEEIVAKWNNKRPGSVSLISVTEITDKEFAEDYIGLL